MKKMARQPKIMLHKPPVKRRKILDHFAIVLCDGPEPRIVERWPKTDAECLYELPPALPYFVCDDFFMPTSFNSSNTKTVRKKWFGRGDSKSSKNQQNQIDEMQKSFDRNTPRFYPFVLTGASGERIYGGALLRLSPNEKVTSSLSAHSMPHHDFNPQLDVEALCFLSRFPFFKLMHDMLYHIHKLSAPALHIEAFGSGSSSSNMSSKPPTKRRNSITESVNSISNSIVAEAASRKPSENDVYLKVVFANAPLGLAFSNSKVSDGSTRLFVVESKGQTGVAGIMLGDEIVELDGVKVKEGTTHEELRLKILELRKSGTRSISVMVRVNTPSEKSFRELPPLIGSGSFSSMSSLKNYEKFPRISPIGLEQLLPHVMSKLRLPPSGGAVDIALGPGPRIVRYSRSATGTMPRVEDASFALLWRLLSVETVVKVVECLVLEQRVVLVSDDVSALAPVAEALLSFLFPFTWSHVYIPLLPTELLMYLDAPVPFLVGISSTYLTLDVVANVLYEAEAGVTAVFLDSDTLCYPGEALPSSNTVEEEKENNKKDSNQNSPNTTNRFASKTETRKDFEYFPKILRDDLVVNLNKSVSSLRGAAENVPSYGLNNSFATGATEYSIKRRKQKRAVKQRQKRSSRHGNSTMNSTPFPHVPEVPEPIVLDESWFNVGSISPVKASTLSSSPPNQPSTMPPGNKFKCMETMDLDAPRFHFVKLWAELLLPYADFMRPHTSVEASPAVPNAASGGTPAEKAIAEKADKQAKEQAKADARDVHGFDIEGFLAVSPPPWRPFLTAFLGTNLFQAFNHSACESLRRDQGRSPKKAIAFFDKLTTASTLDEMRTFVEDSLCNYEEDCDVLTRIHPPLSDKRTPISAANATVFYAYTAFPALSASLLPTVSGSDGGSTCTPEGTSSSSSSVSTSMSSPGKSRPSIVSRRPSGRDLMNAFESGEFRMNRPSMSRTPSNNSIKGEVGPDSEDFNSGVFKDATTSSKLNKPARVSRRASLSGKSSGRMMSQSYPTGLVLAEAEDAIGVNSNLHASELGGENRFSNRLRTSSLDRMNGDMGIHQEEVREEEEDKFKKLASDWLTSNKEKLRLLMSGSINWFDTTSNGYEINADSDAETDTDGEDNQEGSGSETENENSATSRVWIPVLKTVNSFRFGGGTDEDSGTGSVTDEELNKRNRSIDSNANIDNNEASSLSSTDFFHRLSTSSDRRPSFWSDMFSDSETPDSNSNDSFWDSFQAQFSSPTKRNDSKEEPDASKLCLRHESSENTALASHANNEEDEVEERRSSIFEKLHDDLFSSPSKPFWGVFGASSP